MFLGAYRFSGDPAELVPGYDRLMAGMPADAISLHVCVVEEDGITVFDACPTREVFMEFSGGPPFAAAVAAAGLPVAAVRPLGTVHAARLGEHGHAGGGPMIADGTVGFLHSEVIGAGPPCLIAHGGPGLHHGLYRGLDPLAAGHQLVYWDHRGHGRSDPLPDYLVPMSLFADDAVVLADRLGIDTFTVFGHSFGGWVAQELALRHPRRVSALILAATTPGELGSTESPENDQGPPPPADVMELMATQPASDAELIDLYTKLAPHFLRGLDTTQFAAALDPELVSADSMARVFEALGQWSAVDRLGDIACPTLVLGGRHDVFCSPQQLARIARRIAQADHVVFENSGHFMWLEEPDRFFPLVRQWLGDHQSG